MLVKIAWRNIWRNKLRSLVIIFSVILGLWAGAFIFGFYQGMMEQQINTAISQQLSHIQVHNPLFKQNTELIDTIVGEKRISAFLEKNEDVKNFSRRVLITGMASSAHASSGIMIYGVHPEEENSVTDLKSIIKTGNYFDDSSGNQVLIGEKLLHKLKLEPGNKMVITFQNISGELTAGAFRIKGVYKSNNSSIDESTVYAKAAGIEPLLGIHDQYHEIAVLLNDNKNLGQVKSEIQHKAGNNLVQSWRELSPELRLMIDSFDQYMYIIIGIILLALIFGIVNTMLMSVLERYRELGVLMSIGLNKVKIFFMIMLETLFITVTGCVIGLPLAWLSIIFFGYKGIDLSAFAEGLAAFGYGDIIYPKLDGIYYFEIGFMALIATMVASVYPARKALQLKPAEAIRKI